MRRRRITSSSVVSFQYLLVTYCWEGGNLKFRLEKTSYVSWSVPIPRRLLISSSSSSATPLYLIPPLSIIMIFSLSLHALSFTLILPSRKFQSYNTCLQFFLYSINPIPILWQIDFLLYLPELQRQLSYHS
jgi:hypothetical protein